MASVLVIDESRQRTADICTGLIHAGHQVAAVLPSAIELVERIQEIKPDVILIQTESPSRDTLEHLAAMHRDMPRPVIMFSSDGEQDAIRRAIRAGVAAYVVDGVDIGGLRSLLDVAVAHFEERQALRSELAETHRKLSERKVIEKAKGILMKSRGMDEENAYQALRSLAMQRSQPIAQVASSLIDMAGLLI